MDEMINKYALWLHQIQGIGNKKKLFLSRAFGGAMEVYNASEARLKSTNLLNEDEINIILEEKKRSVNLLLDELYAKDMRFVSLEEADYPKRLMCLNDLPYGIYYRGVLVDDIKTCGMVGARMCSQYGKMAAIQLSETLARNGYSIISGMARGIDGHSHRGALNVEGRTIAVLGCGIDICYPNSNRLLYEEIPLNGCIISEYPPGTKPLKELFPRRNRIISALSDMIIVVESRVKSGSLITTDFALEQGKDVYAVPGRVNDPMSEGCNKLIKEGAGIITSFDSLFKDLIDLNGDDSFLKKNNEDENLFLENDERLVYSCLDFYAKSIDEIIEESNLDLIRVLNAIIGLSEKGRIKECFKNEYIKLK